MSTQRCMPPFDHAPEARRAAGEAKLPSRSQSGMLVFFARGGLLFLITVVGCAGPHRDSGASLQTLISRQASLSEEVEKLRGEMRATISTQEAIDHRLSDESLKKPLQERIARGERQIQQCEKRLDALEESFASSQSAWNKKMETVLEVVKSENAQLRKAIAELQKSSVSAGWEHTIARGETLAGIAKEYGARVRDIVEANEIEDPNRISVGQTLFIPRPGR